MYTEKQIEEWKKKAEKWDDLDNAISAFYNEDDDAEREEDDGGSLLDIGEVAARAFGYL